MEICWFWLRIQCLDLYFIRLFLTNNTLNLDVAILSFLCLQMNCIVNNVEVDIRLFKMLLRTARDNIVVFDRLEEFSAALYRPSSLFDN